MIRWAADNDFDSIAWTTGKQQAERYDLSKQIDSLHYEPESKKLFAYRKDDYEPVIREIVEPEKLSDYIGKEAAKKLLDTKLEKIPVGASDNMVPTHILEGQDLEIGGEGMAGFYDDIVVNQARKIGKKHGAKVEEGQIVGRQADYVRQTPAINEDVWTMRLTDKLKKAAKEGLPYYALVPPSLLAIGAQQERQSLLE